MATLVQQPASYQIDAGHTFQKHHSAQNPRQQNQSQLTYSAAIPVLLDTMTGNAGTGSVPSFYKQINIIPGLDASNAVVDTGVQMVRSNASQVQVSSNTAAANSDFDGKRMRRSIQRRTVDYNASTLQMIKHRLYRRSVLQKPVVQPDPLYYPEIVLPRCVLDNPINSVTTRFVRASTNKVRCPVFSVAWTPEGRRVVTGTSSGEFTLWNGLTFNFETILQAHESAVRAMEWSHNDMWLLSGDHNGVIKYWQSNMNNVKMIQAHTDPVRGLSFCPTDNKFVTCSDDGLIKVWDFYRCVEEKALRGHGADVKCVGWHPFKCMIASGSKDSQQPLKLWDPKSGNSLATIHGHKSTVMGLDWNKNGNWLLTGSRDRLVKVFDIRMMKEIYTFRGHKKEAASVNWHPLYEEMFASGGSDGSIMFWLLGCEKELGSMENAHDGMIWDLKWHPLGHILCSGSNDHTTKFWTRNRPGDKMRDKYNLNILPTGFDDDYEYELPNSSQSDVESGAVLDNSKLNSSIISTNTPWKCQLEENPLDSPIVKALLEQNSLEVTLSQVSETPAEVYTVSHLRPTAPVFKIDAQKQKKAIDDVENIEKRREKMLRRGDEKSQKRRRASNHDDVSAVNAPSLLDLNIAAPSFLKDHEWGDDSEPPPFIEDLKRTAAERNPESANTNLFPVVSSGPSANVIERTNNFSSGGNYSANHSQNGFAGNNHQNNFSGINTGNNFSANNVPGNNPGNYPDEHINKPNTFSGRSPPFNNPGYSMSNQFPENIQKHFDGPPLPRPPPMDHPPRSMPSGLPPPNNRGDEFANRPLLPPADRFNNHFSERDMNFNRMNGPPPPRNGPPPPRNGPPPPRNNPNDQFHDLPPGRYDSQRYNDNNFNRAQRDTNQGPPSSFDDRYAPDNRWDDEHSNDRWHDDNRPYRRGDMRR